MVPALVGSSKAFANAPGSQERRMKQTNTLVQLRSSHIPTKNANQPYKAVNKKGRRKNTKRWSQRQCKVLER